MTTAIDYWWERLPEVGGWAKNISSRIADLHEANKSLMRAIEANNRFRDVRVRIRVPPRGDCYAGHRLFLSSFPRQPQAFADAALALGDGDSFHALESWKRCCKCGTAFNAPQDTE